MRTSVGSTVRRPAHERTGGNPVRQDYVSPGPRWRPGAQQRRSGCPGSGGAGGVRSGLLALLGDDVLTECLRQVSGLLILVLLAVDVVRDEDDRVDAGLLRAAVQLDGAVLVLLGRVDGGRGRVSGVLDVLVAHTHRDGAQVAHCEASAYVIAPSVLPASCTTPEVCCADSAAMSDGQVSTSSYSQASPAASVRYAVKFSVVPESSARCTTVIGVSGSSVPSFCSAIFSSFTGDLAGEPARSSLHPCSRCRRPRVEGDSDGEM